MVAKKSSSPKPNSKKHLNRLLFIVPGLMLLACVILGGLELTNVTHFLHKSPPAQAGPTPEQKKQEAKVEADQKKQAIENPPATTPSSSPADSSISLSTREESNGTLTVFTNLGNIANGSCSLIVTNGSATTTQTANVIYQPQYSTCAGFSVLISRVGSGNWTLTLNVTSAGATATKSIQAEVR